MGANRWVARGRCRVGSLGVAALLGGLLVVVAPASPAAADPCAPLANPVACENSKPGTSPSVWDTSGSGSPSIQGFATDISTNVGSTVQFKVSTPARSYRLDVYRLGYYAGLGARLIASVTPSATLPQTQPSCLTDSTTGLVDCGSWRVSASWTIPAGTVSGVFIAHLVRTDGTTGDSQVPFVVRDDSSHSAIDVQTSDTTWQAYNQYGGNSLYTGSPAGRAYKVSYNRPITTRGTGSEDYLFHAEFPMIRFLEANGYDVSYTSGVDTDRAGALIKNHQVFLSVGHDEYWSGQQRANVEAARDAGVSLAFFSGNESFWKTRWEPSTDGSSTAYRTLVCYKETTAGAKIDPTSTWTGTWRDPRFSPPSDGGRPENRMTGTLFMVNGGVSRADSIKVPAADGKMRFWRGTTLANQSTNATATLPAGTLGYEWDAQVDNGSRPPGLVPLSTATYSITNDLLVDYGSTYGSGTATHSATLYRAPSGALVFGAGSVQWSWGLDATHDNAGPATSAPMRQATVNLLADMGVQPATLVSGLTAATRTTDTTAPTSTITAPAAGSTLAPGQAVTVTGTAGDVGGQVGGVEVSTDGGTTWHPATGRASWSYSWTPATSGSTTLRSRAVDDSGNVETPSAGVTVNGGGTVTCPCTIFGSATPGTAADPDTTAVELGVKLRASTSGSVTGIRFYKASTNTGTHTGSLWTASGTRLATATFSSETASGWQQVSFASPVAITAGTTYVASYYAPNGHYAADDGYFTSTGVTNGPLTALRSGTDGPNGVYSVGPGFPASTYQDANYWVDVIFTTGSGGGTTDTTAPTVTARTPAAGATGVSTGTTVTATFSEPVQTTGLAFTLTGPSGAVPAAVALDAARTTATLTPSAALAASTTYTAAVSGAKDAAGNTMTAVSWSFTTAAAGTTTCPCTIFGTAVPATPAVGDGSAVELGTRFRASTGGSVTGVRFYKGTGNTGTHTGSLWSSSGTRLATATFSAETASGWQQVSFASPVAITAGTTYVVSYYAPVGHYAADSGYFASKGVTNGPLTALQDGTDGPNGAFRYGTGGGFPTDGYRSTSYWVDVVFTTGSGGGTTDTTAPTVTARTPAAGATGVSTGTTVTATFSEPVQASSVAFTLAGPSGAVPATVGLDGAGTTATLTPSSALAAGTTYTASVSGAKDVAGNTMTAVSWSFSTAAASGTCPCSLWDTSTTPGTVADPDTSSVELGVRVTPSRSGSLTAVRFYKASTNTGTHVVRVWSATGTLLASATATGETASGWQTVPLASPLALTGGTTYVVSYRAPVGHYSVDQGYFTVARTNGPLTAPATGNGVYTYGASGTFPSSTYQASNYWVDVVFS